MSMRRYDLVRLKRVVGVAHLLAYLGLLGELRRHGHELVGRCPLPDHGGDRSNTRAFGVNLVTGLWNCFTCCGGGDLVELAARFVRGDYAAAARLLVEVEGAPPPLPAVSAACQRGTRERPRPPFKPYRRQLRLDPMHHFLKGKQIAASTARLFETGAWPCEGFLDGCIGVRLYDLDGAPLGYAGRRLQPADVASRGKWKLPRGFPKQDVLYNWHRAKVHASSERGVVLVEGPFDAMRVHQAGFAGVVALQGTTISSAQENILRGCRGVLLLFDGDRAGRQGAESAGRRLAGVPTRRLSLPDGLGPPDLSDTALRAVLSGPTT